jgi:hypothetical protein
VADDTKNNDLAIEPDSGGLAFRFEMWFTDTLVRWWKHILAAGVAVLIGALMWGQWRNMVQSEQRNTTSAIADAQNKLPGDLTELAMRRAGFGGDEQKLDVGKLEDSATEIFQIASSAKGTARMEAALKAAEIYRLAGDGAGRRKALMLVEGEGSGVLRYAVLSGLAAVDVEDGQPDNALRRLESLFSEQDFLAQRAMLDAAAMLEALQRGGEAVRILDQYLTRWPDASDKDEVARRRDRLAGTKAPEAAPAPSATPSEAPSAAPAPE